MFSEALERLYERYNVKLACASAFLMPLKLSLCYLVLIPLIVLWLVKFRSRLSQVIRDTRWLSVPFLFFASTVTVSSFFGMDVTRSLLSVPRMVFLFCTVLVFRDVVLRVGPFPPLLWLTSAQALAGVHSLIESALQRRVPRFFLGEVTESGQIAITLVTAAGLAILTGRIASSESGSKGLMTRTACHGILCCAAAVILGFSTRLGLGQGGVVTLAVVALVLIIMGWVSSRPASNVCPPGSRELFIRVGTVILPILLAALIVNLKRGPWAGVMIGCSVLLFVYARRLVLPILIGIVAVLIIVEPVRQRLQQSSEDFFVTGGRSEIWDVGVELATRYPLGIGYRNSPVLNKFSYRIPPEMTHFHNNVINIVAERGWLSLGLFFWWLVSVLAKAFSCPAAAAKRPLVLGIGCAILSWQVAGLVEYNFGDSEVLLVAYAVMGVLAGVTAPEDPLRADQDAPPSEGEARGRGPVWKTQ